MASVKNLAQEVFIELKKKKNLDSSYNGFTKELKRLYEDEIVKKKKSNCPISEDCSLHGCYRYFCCDFKDKIV